MITGVDEVAVAADIDVIHAGHRRSPGPAWSTAGGRVLAVRATGRDVATARARAYEGVAAITFPGAHWRTDIAAEPLGVVEGASLKESVMTVPNVLAARYAAARPGRASGRPSTRSCSSGGCGSPCCEAQRDLGVEVPDGVVEAYETGRRRRSTWTRSPPASGSPATT